MQRRAVATPAGELAVAEAGEGGRPFLLVHGFTGAKEDFTDWIEPFAARGWHAVAVDLRGHGASVKPADESAYSLAAFAGDVLATADALGWERFTLLGHSMGGMAAQLVAIRDGERLDGLVLMDSTHGSVQDVDPEQAELAVALARAGGTDAIADVTAGYDGPLTTAADRRARLERPGYAEFGEAKLRACAGAMYAAMVPQLLHQDDRLEALGRVTVPTLVIAGEEDPLLEPSRRMAAAIPGAELVVVRGGGHSPQFEAPEAWWAAVAAFTDRVRAMAEAR